mmetsp:Transcript_48140/g.109132  ORF Transcript_48140/g.109132 Transcript_48140/m.109132 type:complete len:459 (+) Transcript_48140:84-1460(+)
MIGSTMAVGGGAKERDVQRLLAAKESLINELHGMLACKDSVIQGLRESAAFRDVRNAGDPSREQVALLHTEVAGHKQTIAELSGKLERRDAEISQIRGALVGAQQQLLTSETLVSKQQSQIRQLNENATALECQLRLQSASSNSGGAARMTTSAELPGEAGRALDECTTAILQRCTTAKSRLDDVSRSASQAGSQRTYAQSADFRAALLEAVLDSLQSIALSFRSRSGLDVSCSTRQSAEVDTRSTVSPLKAVADIASVEASSDSSSLAEFQGTAGTKVSVQTLLPAEIEVLPTSATLPPNHVPRRLSAAGSADPATAIASARSTPLRTPADRVQRSASASVQSARTTVSRSGSGVAGATLRVSGQRSVVSMAAPNVVRAVPLRPPGTLMRPVMDARLQQSRGPRMLGVSTSSPILRAQQPSTQVRSGTPVRAAAPVGSNASAVRTLARPRPGPWFVP